MAERRLSDATGMALQCRSCTFRFAQEGFPELLEGPTAARSSGFFGPILELSLSF